MVALINSLPRGLRFVAFCALAILGIGILGLSSGCETAKGRPMTAENMVPTVLLLSAGDVLDITFA
ncbi:MAG: hypothetical protein ACXW3L_05195, partial [Limisphaerales bacterium]